jgi:hypothetical protein
MPHQGHNARIDKGHAKSDAPDMDAFVLEKDIFSNIFERDIRRVYIYKKAERLARAVHMVAPAFVHSPALRERADKVAIGLVDAAILPPGFAKESLSRELLALSSLLSIARTASLLSPMNAELVSREAHLLLQEIAAYEEPRLLLDHAPTLAELASAARRESPESAPPPQTPARRAQPRPQAPRADKGHKGHSSDTVPAAGRLQSDASSSRRDAILSILASKGPSYIKDISTLVRGVSEKTIQRELGALVAEGKVARKGERRWTTYSLA